MLNAVPVHSKCTANASWMQVHSACTNDDMIVTNSFTGSGEVHAEHRKDKLMAR